MRSNHILFLGGALLFILHCSPALGLGFAQENAATKKIESSVRQFFTSMSTRDFKSLQAVLDTQLVGIEATGQNAGIHWLDTTDDEEMFPPKGNDDWDDVGVADMKIELSTTHPSVAVASFTLTFPLDAGQAATLRDAVEKKTIELSDAQKKVFDKMIKDQVVRNSMFAMLARRNGKWKIICMSLPK